MTQKSASQVVSRDVVGSEIAAQDAEIQAAHRAAHTDVATPAEIDDLLDEIDSVLEDNAEEFVRNYVQKGGQ